jgi:hypothetical protein
VVLLLLPADATLSFELAEKVLRDRLKWLVTAGAGLKALLTSALAHGLRAAADMGEVGHAAGGTTAGASRASEEELLTPFPSHVLVRLAARGAAAAAASL